MRFLLLAASSGIVASAAFDLGEDTIGTLLVFVLLAHVATTLIVDTERMPRQQPSPRKRAVSLGVANEKAD